MSSQVLNPAPIDRELAEKLERDDAFRRRYIRFFAQSEVAAEIRALRKLRRLRQSEVARLAKTGQSAISRIEKAGYDGWTFKTLISIAEELRARLRITFEPIEDVVGGYRRDDSDVAHTLGDIRVTGDTSAATALGFGDGTFGLVRTAETTEQPDWVN